MALLATDRFLLPLPTERTARTVVFDSIERVCNPRSGAIRNRATSALWSEGHARCQPDLLSATRAVALDAASCA
ncbi:hypothetical protein [Paracoccus sp. Ld10]|uniref:hypothetical protein n=1 Tax=Paracoccus sp. Ld10 TaxID=649158 RepID=UPI003864BDA5